MGLGMATKWYVIAQRGSDGAYRLPLLGPFNRMREAQAMLEPVQAAVRESRTGRSDLPPDTYVRVDTLNARGGRIDLSVAVTDEWREHCYNWRRP